MLPARSISTSGSDSSRWLSAATAAENSRPSRGADGSEGSGTSVRISSLPVYVTGTAAAKGHATTRYVPEVRFSATTSSVFEPPSLEPMAWPVGLNTVRISSCRASPHVMLNVKVAFKEL